jgi:hypothetical protein
LQSMEREVGGYKIVAMVNEPSTGGYVAGVRIECVNAQPGAARSVFEESSLSAGHRFDSAQAALRHALDMGHKVLRLRQGQVA